jgi:hypothetical protein
MSKQINDRLEKYIIHKTFILTERIYLAIIDKIYDAENYDNFEIDSNNNIYVVYSVKRDESIISDGHELIIDQIQKQYRKNLERKLEEEGYFIEFDDSDINIYFQEPLKINNKSSLNEYTSIKFPDNETNILKYVNNTKSSDNTSDEFELKIITNNDSDDES